MKFEHEVKVGAFIFVSLSLLIFVILWLHKFDMASYLNITAKFEDAGTLSVGSNVLYRGVKAGTVYDIDISEDEKYALVRINITNKEIHIYEGSVASVVDKGFTGTKALAITPPDSIEGKTALKNGDFIEGKRSFTLDELQKTLTKLSDEITFEDIVRELYLLLQNTTELSKKIDTLIDNTEEFLTEDNADKVSSFLDNTTSLSKNLQTTSTQLNKVLTNKKLAKDFSESLTSTTEAMETLNKVVNKAGTLVDKSANTVDNLNSTVTKIDETINNPEVSSNLHESMQKMSDILTDVKEITGDNELKENLKGSIKESQESFNRLNCFSKELSNTLSKRFLLPRLFIGNPGKSLNHCAEPKKIIEAEKLDIKKIDD